MYIDQYIAANRTQFETYCSQHHVASIYGFGSAATEAFDPEKSDVDLLVDIDEPDPLKRGEYLIKFWEQMETFFNRKVDLLTRSSLKNPYLIQSIEEHKILLYAR